LKGRACTKSPGIATKRPLGHAAEMQPEQAATEIQHASLIHSFPALLSPTEWVLWCISLNNSGRRRLTSRIRRRRQRNDLFYMPE
jgi:hypothetical protein